MKTSILFSIIFVFSMVSFCDAYNLYEKQGFIVLIDAEETMVDTYLDVDRLLLKTDWKRIKKEPSLDTIILMIGISKEKYDVFVRGAGYKEMHITAAEIVQYINRVLHKNMKNTGRYAI